MQNSVKQLCSVLYEFYMPLNNLFLTLPTGQVNKTNISVIAQTCSKNKSAFLIDLSWDIAQNYSDLIFLIELTTVYKNRLTLLLYLPEDDEIVVWETMGIDCKRGWGGRVSFSCTIRRSPCLRGPPPLRNRSRLPVDRLNSNFFYE